MNKETRKWRIEEMNEVNIFTRVKRCTAFLQKKKRKVLRRLRDEWKKERTNE
jgi:hypothetical protein